MTFTEKVKHFLYAHRFDIAIAAAIFVIAAIPRLTGLGTFLTADEKNWLGRSYEFVRAFKDFRFNDMLQTTHPGVTTLWFTGLAITAKMFVSHTVFNSSELFNFIKAAQFPIAFTNALAIPFVYLFLRQLFKNRTLSIVAALIIALDPLLVGYSRVAHVDALLASFLFLSALATLIYVKKGYSRSWLIISAVLSALAILTKLPAVFILPFFLLVILVEGKAAWKVTGYIQDRSRDLVIWGLVIVLLGIIIWPAIMWVPNPGGNALTVKRDLLAAVETPHDTTEDYNLSPWHYPAALLDRTTPPTLVLSVIAAITILFLALTRKELSDKKQWLLLLAYILFFIVMMTLGAKKGDRYILPVWPAVDTLAALGIILVSKKISEVKFALPVIAGVVCLYMGWILISYHPYYIAYSNPLFPDNLSQELGWGEGLDQVATWLNANHPNAVVASWYPQELGAFTSARVASITAHEQLNGQYVVLYRNMFGRDPSNSANDFIDEYYSKKSPVYVAHIQGKEFAWVYAKRVYERIAGEILPDTTVSQIVSVDHPQLSGFEIWFATYSGKATIGNVTVTANDDNNVLGAWTIPVKDIEDTKATQLTFPQVLKNPPKTMNITITASGTSVGNAPSVRYTRDFTWREQNMVLNGKSIPGNMAIRLDYQNGNQVVTEDDTLLLSSVRAHNPE